MKPQEVQRATLAEMRHDVAAAQRHPLAAAHLELALADDYAEAGEDALATRSRLSAASCFWRAGRVDQAQDLLDALTRDRPGDAAVVRQVADELQRDHPNSTARAS